MILVALRGLWGRKTRAVLTAISIVLGTAMIAGTFVVRDQITGAFTSIFQTGLEKTDVLASKQHRLHSDQRRPGRAAAGLADRHRSRTSTASPRPRGRSRRPARWS